MTIKCSKIHIKGYIHISIQMYYMYIYDLNVKYIHVRKYGLMAEVCQNMFSRCVPLGGDMLTTATNYVLVITQTRPCNIQQYFKAVKMTIFS